MTDACRNGVFLQKGIDVDTLPTSGPSGPAVTADTAFFWEGAQQHRLLIQRCTACRKLRHPPGPACPDCHSLDWESSEVSGRGRLHSYTIVHHPPPPGFTEPAVGIVVELEEGVRLISNLEGTTPLRIGEPLEVTFLDQTEGWTVPQFRRPNT
jgi:uncharacterized OB-fold protein